MSAVPKRRCGRTIGANRTKLRTNGTCIMMRPARRAGGTSPRSELEGPLPTEARLGGAASGDVARSRWAVAFMSGRVAVTVTGRCSVVKGHFDIPPRSGRTQAFFAKSGLLPPLGRPLALPVTATPACSHPAMPVPVCSWPARAASSRCSWRTPTPHRDSAYFNAHRGDRAARRHDGECQKAGRSPGGRAFCVDPAKFQLRTLTSPGC